MSDSLKEKMDKEQLEREQWKEEKRKKKARFTALQRLPYEVKVKRAELRAIEFVNELDNRGLNAHVSVGGLDSIVLLCFLRKIGIDIPAVSVSSLEDKSIQNVHKELGVISIAPGKSKVEILNEVGFPVISKKIAGRIDTLQHPTDRNKTDSEYTWKKGHIVSISYEKEMKKSGNFGCTIVARMRKREKSSDGGRYWIT